MVARVMISGTWRPMAEALAIVNHGSHDQRTHGRKGGGPGSGEDLLAAGRGAEIAQAALDAAGGEVAGRRLYRGGGVGPHGDEALYSIAGQQGFDGPAATASRREMTKGVRQGDTEMFRGVRPSQDGSKTAAQVHEQVHAGDAHYGLGYAGNGYYMSGSSAIAGTYGQVGRYSLHRDSRTVDFRDLQREQAEYLSTVPAGSAEARVFADPGRYAAARGYDAIKWRRGEEVGDRPGAEDEYIVLNRTALTVQAP